MPVEPTMLFQGVFDKGYADGSGFHASAGQGAGVAVQGQAQTHDRLERADYFLCGSAQDVENVLGIGGGVGVGNPLESVQAKVNFTNSMRISGTDMIILAAAMQKQTYSGVTFQPRSDIQFFNAAEGITDRQRFNQQYGLVFISEIVIGAEFFAYFKISSQSVAQKQQTMAGISAGLGSKATLNANLSAQIQTSLGRARQTQQVSSGYVIIGAQQAPLSSDQLIDFALKFPSLPMQGGAVMSYQTGDYRTAGISSLNT